MELQSNDCLQTGFLNASPDKYEVQPVFLGHRATLLRLFLRINLQMAYLLSFHIKLGEEHVFNIEKITSSLISRLNTHISV